MLQNAYTPGSRRIRENPLFISIDDRWIPLSERTPETANLLNPAEEKTDLFTLGSKYIRFKYIEKGGGIIKQILLAKVIDGIRLVEE